MNIKWIQDAVVQWRQNQRLRYAVLVVIVIVSMHGILKLADKRDEVAKEWGRDQELITRLQAVTSEPEWIKRGALMQQRLRSTILALPLARTMGQAKADQSVWLADLAKRAEFTTPRVLVEDALEVPKHPGLVQVVARLEADAVPPWTLSKPLRSLGQALPWRQVERAEFTSANPTRFSVIVRSYYRTPEVELPAAPKPVASASSPDSANAAMAGKRALGTARARSDTQTSAKQQATKTKELTRPKAVPEIAPNPTEGGVLEGVLDETSQEGQRRERRK